MQILRYIIDSKLIKFYLTFQITATNFSYYIRINSQQEQMKETLINLTFSIVVRQMKMFKIIFFLYATKHNQIK